MGVGVCTGEVCAWGGGSVQTSMHENIHPVVEKHSIYPVFDLSTCEWLLQNVTELEKTEDVLQPLLLPSQWCWKWCEVWNVQRHPSSVLPSKSTADDVEYSKFGWNAQQADLGKYRCSLWACDDNSNFELKNMGRNNSDMRDGSTKKCCDM